MQSIMLVCFILPLSLWDFPPRQCIWLTGGGKFPTWETLVEAATSADQWFGSEVILGTGSFSMGYTMLYPTLVIVWPGVQNWWTYYLAPRYCGTSKPCSELSEGTSACEVEIYKDGLSRSSLDSRENLMYMKLLSSEMYGGFLTIFP